MPDGRAENHHIGAGKAGRSPKMRRTAKACHQMETQTNKRPAEAMALVVTFMP